MTKLTGLNFDRKNVAIIGGTGTLGYALVKAILEGLGYPSKLLIISRDEIKQCEMLEVYPESKYPFMDFKLGDVRDLERMKELVQNMHYVIHAAAIKHVVMAERNPEECHKTNFIGTRNVIEACKANNVSKAILISTDKAVNPIGVYGKSKKQAEMEWLNANSSTLHSFKVVRLGNIIGARGSVFEAFQRQRKTGVIKVTHPEATRFCISKEEAASFVIQALFSRSTKPLTPEMDAFKVIDLAKKMAPECEIEFIGLREGDKLHEELDGTFSGKLCKETI